MGSRRSSRVALSALLASVWLFQPIAAEGKPHCLGKPVTKIARYGANRTAGTNGRDVILGSYGRDFIVGFNGEDRICGRGGNDLIFPGKGRDRLSGGPGMDAVSWNDATVRGGVVASLKSRRAHGGGDLDTWKEIEVLAGSPHGDVLTGSQKGDLILGIGGDDRINGGRGNDLLLGMKQSDDIVGGPGKKDTASFYLDTYEVRASLRKGRALADGRDTLAGIEALEGTDTREIIYGDTLIGDKKPNYLYGVGGRDGIAGGGGRDVVAGGLGLDYLFGQEGDDFVYGEGGNDYLGGTPEAHATEKGNDVLIGGLYKGGDKADWVYGGPGSDLLHGGLGWDQMDGGSGEDVVDYTLARKGISVTLSGASENDGAGGQDALTFVEAIFGSSHNDVLLGDGERNYLFGGHGVDALSGGEGNDVLRGMRDDDDLFGEGGDDALNGGEDKGDGDTDNLDGGIGIDSCKNGESNFMCEPPLPVDPPPVLPASLAELGLIDERLRPFPHIERVHRLVRLTALAADAR